MAQQAYKAPAEVSDEMIDWLDGGGSCPVLAPGETITGTPVDTVTGGDGLLVVDVKPPSATATTSTVWLGGGTAGQVYYVTVTITTSGGRTLSRTFMVFVNAVNSL